MSKPVAIITGASRGIGKAIANELLAKDYHIVVVSNEKEELEDAFAGQLHSALVIYGDLTDLSFAQTVVTQTLDRWGRIDVLVNNAAWRALETIRNLELEHWEKTLKICLTVPAFLAKWVAAAMEERNIAGTIINISSIMSDRVAGSSAAYVVAKGGLLSLTYELATLYGPSGIRAVAVSPGNIHTQLSQDFADPDGINISDQLVAHVEGLTPLRRSGEAKEVAQLVVWLCDPAASFITGTNIVIDGGLTKNLNSYQMKKLQFPDQF
ncbi:MAG: SDR family oxidoreductase [Saprospiraceae bacterium]|nr:SDR family oxidoreductase [Saprospiraceae bacterium]